MQVSRRSVLKMAGAAALGAVAAPALAAGTAEATAPVIPSMGTMYVAKLWGLKTVKVKRLVSGRLRTVRVKVPATRNLFRGTGPSSINNGLGLLGDSDPIGSTGHSWIFGHRTTHGGPLRNLHKLVAGDTIDVLGYRYIVLAPGKTVDAYIWQRDPVTDAVLYSGRGSRRRPKRAKRYDAINNVWVEISNNEGVLRDPQLDYEQPLGGRLSLIGCSKQNRLPTSTDFRLVVHAQLQGPVPPA